VTDKSFTAIQSRAFNYAVMDLLAALSGWKVVFNLKLTATVQRSQQNGYNEIEKLGFSFPATESMTMK